MRQLARATMVLATLLTAGPARAQGAAANFETKCATCHGKDGKGHTKLGERLALKDLAAFAGAEADVEKVITDGKGKMPAFKGRLTEGEIKELAAYVKGGLK